VAEFTRDVNRAKVMSAQSLMTRGKTREQHAGKVEAKAKIETFAADIVAAKAPFAVVDGNGALLGEIAPEAVVDLLAGRKTSELRP
jgi:glycine betaine/proline transport system ATP-binding protein